MPAPQYVRRSYGGGADVASLVQSIGPTDIAFTIAPDTGWVEDDGSPLGTVGPFSVVVDRFTPGVEKILCSSIDLATGLVNVFVDPVDGWTGRGYDRSTAIAHVPGGSAAGVQTCWTATEADEANQVVYDVLGGGGGSNLIGVPIGGLVPFAGSGFTLPANFLVADGSAVSRITYSALFTATVVSFTGDSTTGSPVINNVSGGATSWMGPGTSLTLAASGGAIYTVLSVTGTSLTLTSGTGITAATAGDCITYPAGPGDGSTSFNIPDLRGRTAAGWGGLGLISSQPLLHLGFPGGSSTVALTQSELPTSIGTAAAQGISVSNPPHSHAVSPASFVVGIGPGQNNSINSTPGGSSGADGVSFAVNTSATTTGISASASQSAVSNPGGGSGHDNMSPYYTALWLIRAL